MGLSNVVFAITNRFPVFDQWTDNHYITKQGFDREVAAVQSLADI